MSNSELNIYQGLHAIMQNRLTISAKSARDKLIKDFKIQKQKKFSTCEYRKYNKELSSLEKEGLIKYVKMIHGLSEKDDTIITFEWIGS